MEVVIAFALIVALLVVLGSGLWIGLSLLGVAVLAMQLFTSRPVGDSATVSLSVPEPGTMITGYG